MSRFSDSAQRNFSTTSLSGERPVELGLACGVVFEPFTKGKFHLSRDDRLYQKMVSLFRIMGNSCILVQLYTKRSPKSKGKKMNTRKLLLFQY